MVLAECPLPRLAKLALASAAKVGSPPTSAAARARGTSFSRAGQSTARRVMASPVSVLGVNLLENCFLFDRILAVRLSSLTGEQRHGRQD